MIVLCPTTNLNQAKFEMEQHVWHLPCAKLSTSSSLGSHFVFDHEKTAKSHPLIVSQNNVITYMSSTALPTTYGRSNHVTILANCSRHPDLTHHSLPASALLRNPQARQLTDSRRWRTVNLQLADFWPGGQQADTCRILVSWPHNKLIDLGPGDFCWENFKLNSRFVCNSIISDQHAHYLSVCLLSVITIRSLIFYKNFNPTSWVEFQ